MTLCPSGLKDILCPVAVTLSSSLTHAYIGPGRHKLGLLDDGASRETMLIRLWLATP